MSQAVSKLISTRNWEIQRKREQHGKICFPQYANFNIEKNLASFVSLAEWKNEESLDAHLKASHVKEFVKSFESHTTVEYVRRYQKIL